MWGAFVRLVVVLVVSYMLRPKPQTTPPAGLADVQAPTAEEGREIPVLFGTRDLPEGNVVWYGHLRTSAIRKSGGKK